MSISYQADERLLPKMCLSEVWPCGFENPTPLKKSFIAVGVVTEIIYSNEKNYCFNVQDVTRKIRVDTFKDNYDPGFVISKGDLIEFKVAEFGKNIFGEFALKVYKIRLISLQEEMIHYLEVQYRRKLDLDTRKSDIASEFQGADNGSINRVDDQPEISIRPLIDEEQVLMQDYIDSVQENRIAFEREVVYKRIFSMVFFMAEDLASTGVEANMALTHDQIFKSEGFIKFRNLIRDDDTFEELKNHVLHTIANQG